MSEHTFTLLLTGRVDDHLDELYEAGCDDAVIGSIDGVHFAEFTREAPSLAAAIAGAMADVARVHGISARARGFSPPNGP